MKVCVISTSGNVGKTTISRQLLAPRMKAPEFAVETMHAIDIGGREMLHVSQFATLYERLRSLDSAIVDVSANAGVAFLNAIAQHPASLEVFDYFVVPTVQRHKEQEDAISTIDRLFELGVTAEKVRVVLNLVIAEDYQEMANLPKAFSELRDCTCGSIPVSPVAVIFKNAAFEYLWSEDRRSVADLLSDKTDYGARLHQATNEVQRNEAIDLLPAQRLALTANRNLDEVFKILFEERVSA